MKGPSRAFLPIVGETQFHKGNKGSSGKRDERTTKPPEGEGMTERHSPQRRVGIFCLNKTKMLIEAERSTGEPHSLRSGGEKDTQGTES